MRNVWCLFSTRSQLHGYTESTIPKGLGNLVLPKLEFTTTIGIEVPELFKKGSYPQRVSPQLERPQKKPLAVPFE
jgi:hypothetical protein